MNPIAPDPIAAVAIAGSVPVVDGETIENAYRRLYPTLVRLAFLLVDTQELAEEAVHWRRRCARPSVVLRYYLQLSDAEIASALRMPIGTVKSTLHRARGLLVVGVDADACADGSLPWAGAADPARTGSRTDTIMVIRVDPSAHSVSVLSIPRDLWVGVHGRGMNRINAAYQPNDPSVLAQTVYDTFGIVVDHFVQIDFCAFKRIVDALGGVRVPFPSAVRDDHVGIDIVAGCHLFHGDEALAYVRSRHLTIDTGSGRFRADPTADLGRQARQQNFVRRVLMHALQRGLFDPNVARALLRSLQTDVVTDAGTDGMRDFQLQATGMVVDNQSVLRLDTSADANVAVLDVFRGVASSTPAARCDSRELPRQERQEIPPCAKVM